MGGEELANKDQAIGWLIFVVCVVVIILYLVGLFWFGGPSVFPDTWNIAFALVAIPVLIAFVLILGIGAWIGWTMATTPPPKPIEELETEEKKEAEAEQEKEKKEE
jgi:flagellar basal body-associated protein FliL